MENNISQNVSAVGDDTAAREKALDVSQSFIVRAPAGSGKTELLTQRALACLATVDRPEEVLTLTFTNKAVHEARHRILNALNRAKSSEQPDAPHEITTWKLARAVLQRDESLDWGLCLNPQRLRVMTIDALNNQLSKQLPLLSRLGGASRVEVNPYSLYRGAIHSLMEELESPTADESFIDSLSDLMKFADCRVEQLEPFLLSMLARRDQWLGQLHDRNTDEMEFALSSLVSYRLQHCYDLLGSTRESFLFALRSSGAPTVDGLSDALEWPAVDPDYLNQWVSLATLLITKSGSLRKKVTKATGWPAKTDATKEMNNMLLNLNESPGSKELAKALEDVVVLPGPDYPAVLNDFRVSRTNILDHLVAHLMVVFEKNGCVDFCEVSLRAIAALGDENEVLDALLIQDYITKHILVDEVQDNSSTQYRLLGRLISGWEIDDGRTLFMVGDPQQSIYAFRQADVGLFVDIFQQGRFKQLPLGCLELTKNFRSMPAVVDWFNASFSKIFPSYADPYTDAVTFAPSIAAKKDDNESMVSGVFAHAIDSHGKEFAEASHIINLVKTTQTNSPDNSIAILVRSRTHLFHIIPELKKAGIDFSCQDIDPLAGKSAVADVVSLVRALWHFYDRGAWIGLMRSPFVGLSWADCLAISRGKQKHSIINCLRSEDVVAALSEEGQSRVNRFLSVYDTAEGDRSVRYNLPEKAKVIWNALGGPACITSSESADIDTLFRLVAKHSAGGQLIDAKAFEEDLSRLFASPESGRVQIMTIHKAKGLEFDTVILPSLHKGGRNDDPPLLHHRNLPDGYLIVPHPGRRADETSPEYRLYSYLGRLGKETRHSELLRLLYVAVTRARSQLHLVACVGDNKPRYGSLLSLLWPSAESDFKKVTISTGGVSTTENNDDVLPLAPRLPVSWEYPESPQTYVPAIHTATMPSELVIQDAHALAQRTGEAIEDRTVGVLYHSLMERMSIQGIDFWNNDMLNEQRSGLRAACRHFGVPEPTVEQCVDRVIALGEKTLNCKHGQWLLKSHEESHSEYELSGYLNGQWARAIVDRLIKDKDTTWVVDYKTWGKEGASENEIMQEVVRHRPQLKRYAEMVSAHHGCNVRCAIYFPAIQRFEEVFISSATKIAV